MASISTSSRIHVRWASLSACTRQSSRHYARTTFVRPALATDTSRMQTLYVEAQHSTNPVTNASPYSTAQEQLFTSTTSESSIPSSIQRDMLGQRLFLFNTSVCVTCCAMTAMLVVAIPTLLSIKRAAESLEKFLDVTREELPGTMAAVRLSGMEISDLTMELSDLSQEISSGMKNSARALRAAQDGILRVGNMPESQSFRSLKCSDQIDFCFRQETKVSNLDQESQFAARTEKQECTEIEKGGRNNLREDVTLIRLLKDCGKQKNLCKGSRLHVQIAEKGLHKKNIFLGSALVTMYANCGALSKAQEAFDDLPSADVVSWTALIAGYAQHGQSEEAIRCFEQMQYEGMTPDALTFACILKACSTLGTTEMGRELHCKIIKHGLYDRNTVLCTALVDMYAKCGALGKAQQVFDELLVQDVVSWTALISGYCQHQHGEKALACLHKMQQTDLLPNAMTLACILKACSSIGSVNDGRIAHADIIKRGIGRNDNALGVALVDMYAKCGLFSEAKHVFDKLAVQDSSMWNAIITGYCQYGHGHEAVDCYEFMRHGAAKPDEVTYACILKACGSIGALDKGQEIHFEIMRERWLEKFSMLGSALVDMYAKCGALVKAQKVFDKLAIKDAAAWTALIAGYFQRGYGGEALASFEQMLHEGHTPDEAIFSYVLKTCSILAAPEKGQQYFEVMTCYGIIPTLEHHTCIIDLFSRWGQFAKAFEVVTQMPSSDHLPAWLSLLAGCKRWGNLQAARFVFDHVVQLDTKSAVAYLHMSSMYVDAGMQEEAEKIEAMRKEKMYLGGQCITRSLESNVLLG